MKPLRDYFPFPAIRPGQVLALARIEAAVAAGKRYIVIEAPTGIGKSGITMAVARWAADGNVPSQDLGYEPDPGAYILSTQKSLTEQYLKDFGGADGIALPGGRLVEMRGRGNFTCVDAPDTDCGTGAHLDCSAGEAGGCPYVAARIAFQCAPIGVTNFAYFLAAGLGRGFRKRSFVIIDEAHNAEKELLGFYEISLGRARCADLGITSLPAEGLASVKAWVIDTFIPAATKRIEAWRAQAKRSSGLDRVTEARFKKRIAALVELTDKMHDFHDAPDGLWFTYLEASEPRGPKDTIVFKRLSAAPIAEPMLFHRGEFVLMMSATIMNFESFGRNLGIDGTQMECVRLDSEFPLENRPVVYWGVGAMRKVCQAATLPKMLRRIETILDRCEGVKGIIHTHSYVISQAVMRHLEQTPHRARLLTHTSERGSREGAISRHTNSAAPTVLVSPSMTEGLDLKGALSRFQILCKVPYPFLDPYTIARRDRDPQWYTLQAGLTMVQASGRSVRTADDWAYTFILDSDFGYFFREHSYLLSAWWTRSVKKVTDAEAEEYFVTLQQRRVFP